MPKTAVWLIIIFTLLFILGINIRRLRDDARAVGTDDDPGDEKSHDGRHIQPLKDEHDGERGREKDDQVPQDRPFSHRSRP